MQTGPLSLREIRDATSQSLVGLAAYQSATLLVDRARSLPFDYRRRTAVRYEELRLPKALTGWTREALWNELSAQGGGGMRLPAAVQLWACLSAVRDVDTLVDALRAFTDEALLESYAVADLAIEHDATFDRWHARILVPGRALPTHLSADNDELRDFPWRGESFFAVSDKWSAVVEAASTRTRFRSAGALASFSSVH